jgi:mRNA interferase MazF
MQNENQNIKIGEKYIHYKTKGMYEILSIGIMQASKESDLDMEECVTYKKVESLLLGDKNPNSDFDNTIWVRPIKMFLEKVKDENGNEVNRFIKIEDFKVEQELHLFDKWSELKKDLSNKISLEKYHQREIWWSSIGKNIGNEQDDKNNNFERPVLILKKWNSDFFIGIPMTTKKVVKEKDSKFYFKYFTNGEEVSYFILTQIRVFSSKRLIRKLSSVRESIFIEIKKSIKNILLDI